jgi:hypothetical protein
LYVFSHVKYCVFWYLLCFHCKKNVWPLLSGCYKSQGLQSQGQCTAKHFISKFPKFFKGYNSFPFHFHLWCKTSSKSTHPSVCCCSEYPVKLQCHQRLFVKWGGLPHPFYSYSLFISTTAYKSYLICTSNIGLHYEKNLLYKKWCQHYWVCLQSRWK